MNAKLMLHAGAQGATRAEVMTIPTPEATSTWQPVPHGTLIDSVLSRFLAAGLVVQREQHGLARDGNRWFGVFDLNTRVEGKDYGISVGVRNSHDQSFAAGVLMGSRVFVCDNLAFSGEVTLVRKHTAEILTDLPGLLDSAMVKLTTLESFMHVRIDHYKTAELDARAAHDFILRSVMGKVMPMGRMKQVYAEWHRPSHQEFEPRNAWSLFNACTEALKKTSPMLLPQRTQRLHLLLDRFVGAPKFDDWQAQQQQGIAIGQLPAGAPVPAGDAGDADRN